MRHQSASLAPNPSLIAILLITKSRAGPRLVFHYPASPSTNPYYTKRDPNWYGTPGNQTDESGVSDSDWSSGSETGERTDDEDDEESRSSRAGSGSASRGSKVKSGKSKSAAGSGSEVDEEVLDEHRGSEAEGGGQEEGNTKAEVLEESEWEQVLGFSADGLSALLSPTRSFNKRKFEVTVEQFVFVGAPIFVREDGFWKKRRRHRKRESVGATNENGYGAEEVNGNGVHHEATPEETPRAEWELKFEQIPGYDAAYGHGLMSGAASEIGSDTKSTSTAAGQGEMTMFNLVFVLNPPSLEHHVRVEEMYDFVIKRYAKTLKYEQAQNNYVAQECRLIMSMKEKGREAKAPIFTLWPNVLGTSALAKSIAITFDQISNNRIAHVNLNGFDTSFQIPQAISTPFIPTATEPQMPGLWLTTATLIDDDEADASLSPHSALLLLENNDTLLKEVENDGKELSGPLSFFIRNLTPTKSLQKLSLRHSMPLKDVQFLARHLIYWRRARAIPPLNRRDFYVVSPNADVRALGPASSAFATRFPTLPPLPKILQMLSGPPKQYRMLMPSQDHRTAYMDILAWLMRGGWVTQLRTFAWVRVRPEDKAAVAAKINKDAKNSELIHVDSDNTNGTTGEESGIWGTINSPHIQRSPESKSATEASYHSSPLLSPYRYPAGPPSDAGSNSSGRTAIQSSISGLSPLQRPESRTLHRPSPLHINQSASPSEDEPSSLSLASHPTDSESQPQNGNAATGMSENTADYEPSLVHSPQKADALESLWIEHIGSQIGDLFRDAEPDVKELWPLLLKYFDGRYALEEISAREGLKKKKVREFLGGLVKNGILVTVRHW